MAPKRLAVQVQFVRFVRFNFNCPKYSEVLLSYLQMIYTCYEMVRDCRADLPQGWAYFISEYVPLIRRLLAHYDPALSADGEFLNRVLLAVRRPESRMFESLEAAPERWFAAELRQRVLAELPSRVPEMTVDLETVAAALEPLTVVEKQAAWFETMHYDPMETGPMVKMEPKTVEKIRNRAAELIRGKAGNWNRALLAENGAALGRQAAEGGKDCLPVKAFLDLIDGRATWRRREEIETHVNRCWHCVDHFCRMLEIVEQLRGLQPLSDAASEPFRKLLGIVAEKPPGWKRLLGRA